MLCISHEDLLIIISPKQIKIIKFCLLKIVLISYVDYVDVLYQIPSKLEEMHFLTILLD